jgi:N-formylglutamate amidohydrolase
MNDRHPWTVTTADGPLVAVAIHAGHELRPEVARHIRLGDAERLREEDPFTHVWAEVAPTRVVVDQSRFEVDLNRPREGAVYVDPEQAWGLDVWASPLPADVIDRSLDAWEQFYAMFEALLEEKRRHYGRFLVYDIHSYNHRRDGPAAPTADPVCNPDVNVGTGSMDRTRWAPLVDRFIADLRAFEMDGAALDVRENVRFRGGYLSQFVHERFPASGCALAIEFKKTFMDEWTGDPHPARVARLKNALASTVPGVLRELER